MLQRFPSYVEQPNNEAWTPLHIAVQSTWPMKFLYFITENKSLFNNCPAEGNFECVKVLLDSGATVNTRNDYGYSAMLLAAATPIQDLEEETQRLNEQKMDSDDKFMSPTEINDIICKLLLDHHPDVNLPDNFGQTPMMFVSLHFSNSKFS